MIIFTTDKVYENLENKIKFREDAPLGGDMIYIVLAKHVVKF